MRRFCTLLISMAAVNRTTALSAVQRWPKLLVFDLDMCLWSPEMYTLDEIPKPSDCISGTLGSRDGHELRGVVGCKSGGSVIKLFDDARLILQDYYLGLFPPETRIAAASSANTPHAVAIGRAAMSLLEIMPGVSMRSVFQRGWPEEFTGHMQIGRTPPLSSDKAASHFPLIQSATQISYREMVFFDDCNWGDHVGSVERMHNVVGQRTPKGLTRREFDICIAAWRNKNDKDT